MSNSRQASQDALYRVLASQYRALVEAGSNPELLSDYAELLRLLRNPGVNLRLDGKSNKRRDFELSPIAIKNVASLALSEVEAAIADDTTSRIELERLAIYRFGIPKGSMRSYSNRERLVQKIQSMVRNERTHETIGEIAGSHDQQN